MPVSRWPNFALRHSAFQTPQVTEMANRRHRYRYSQEPIKLHGSVWTPPFPVARRVSPGHFKCPLPQSDAEFAILSEIVFGKQLSLKKLWLWESTGRFSIAEPYDSYAPRGDGLYGIIEIFRTTIGRAMDCSASLGSMGFKRYGHRHWRRFERWSESRRRNDSRSVRPAFVRLAHRFGVGENIVGRVDRRSDGVLTGGRVDGAPAASIQSHTTGVSKDG